MQRLVFRRYLSKMSWSEVPVWDWGDLSYLLLAKYNAHLQEQLDAAEEWQERITARSFMNGVKGKVTSSL